MKLEGVKSNRSAIGARVLVHYGNKVQAQAVLSQSSYYSCNDPRLHFGLGASVQADVDVYWPNGLHEQLKKISANQLDNRAGRCRGREQQRLEPLVSVLGASLIDPGRQNLSVMFDGKLFQASVTKKVLDSLRR